MLTCSYTQPWECFHFSFSSRGAGRTFQEGWGREVESFEGRDGVSPKTPLKRISVGSANIVFFLWGQREREGERERENERDCICIYSAICICLPTDPSIRFILVSLTLPPSILKELTEETHGSVNRRARGPRAETRSGCRLWCHPGTQASRTLCAIRPSRGRISGRSPPCSDCSTSSRPPHRSCSQTQPRLRRSVRGAWRQSASTGPRRDCSTHSSARRRSRLCPGSGFHQWRRGGHPLCTCSAGHGQSSLEPSESTYRHPGRSTSAPSGRCHGLFHLHNTPQREFTSLSMLKQTLCAWMLHGALDIQNKKLIMHKLSQGLLRKELRLNNAAAKTHTHTQTHNQVRTLTEMN